MFTGFALLQLNDPDPLRWITVYLLTAGHCAWTAAGRELGRWPWLLAAVALVWSGRLVAEGLQADPRAVFVDWGMYGPGVEQAREGLGLLLVAAWSGWAGRHR